MSDSIASRMLSINQAFRHFHDHDIDPAYGGTYYMRLPDGTRVPIEKFEARLAEFRERARAERDARLREKGT